MATKRTTIIDLLHDSVSKYASNPFLWEKKTTEFEPTTYQETQDQSRVFAAGLMALGVKAKENIALLSEGRNDWIISELGILYTGAANVPLSIKLEESNDLTFRLNHSESKLIVVSGQQLPKIRKIVDQLPTVEKIIVLDEMDKYESNEMSKKELLEMGEKFIKKNPNAVLERSAAILPDDLATISYTSGTTADPKGVMLTHRNYTANVEQALSLMTIPTTFKTLIILPLDHCFAHVAGFYSFMASGASVATVQVGKSGFETLRNIPININEIKPNLLLSVPTLAKNFKKNIESNIRKQGKMVQWMFDTAMNMSYSYNKEGHNKGKGVQIFKKPILALFDKILFSKIREGFGGQLEYFIGGGALLDIDLQRFFYAVGMPMYQGYGLSEATPIISSNGEKRHKLGSSGYLVQPMELKICDDEGNSLPNYQKGEIVIKGENVMAGYYRNEKATAETVRDGWLYTGDLGYMDDDGFLYVLGRFKSLLISSDGEKYSPEGIEEAVVENSKLIDQCVLYNDQSQFTSAILAVNRELLARELKQKDANLILQTEEGKLAALKLVDAELNEYRKGGKFEGMFPERWLPSLYVLAEEDFTEANGLINSTMKVVRGKVEERYKDGLDILYSAGGKDEIIKYNLKSLS